MPRPTAFSLAGYYCCHYSAPHFFNFLAGRNGYYFDYAEKCYRRKWSRGWSGVCWKCGFLTYF